jgi:hypothetical protein
MRAWLLAGGLGLVVLAAPAPAQEADLAYNRDIRPILADSCFPCHGPDAAARRAEVRLDVREQATTRRGGRAAIVPGEPEASELLRRIDAANPDDRMPPPESKLSLSDAQRATLREWIRQGAAYQPHWSFVAIPGEVPPPNVEGDAWIRDPLDRFVLASLEAEAITPTPEADRHRWLRRVTYDLTGLPPEPDEIDAFLADEQPGAHERAVDRLLASAHFGERLAVPWLDLARYADSYGYQSDQLSPTWPWRDWVIDAINDNLPYDQFIAHQLAGDLLPDATPEQRLATAFNRLHRMTNEGGSIPEEWRTEYAADRVNTFGTAVLGLTLECARCHDHKYDPISQREYYQLAAFFNSIDEHGLYERTDIVPTPSVLLPTPVQGERLETLGRDIDAAHAHLAQRRRAGDAAFTAWLDATPLPSIPDVVGRFPLDEIGDDGVLSNTAGPDAPPGRIHAGTSVAEPHLVAGVRGQALLVDGDNLAHLPGVGDLDRWTPFTIAFWVRDDEPDTGPRIVAHRSSGTDAGPYGFDLLLDDGQLVARVFRHWPGNAIAVRTKQPVLTPGRWTHVVWRYDGSSRADGLSLHLDGLVVPVHTVRDRLWKTVGGGGTYGPGGHDLILGQRFRDAGLAGGMFDEVVIVRRAVCGLEARHLFDGRALADALADPTTNLDALREWYLSAFDADTRQAAAELEARRQAYATEENAVREVMAMAELPEPRPTYVLARGAYDAPKAESNRVRRGVPACLSTPANDPADRLDLATWVTDPQHPLTARVAANRLWQVCFGHGLAPTSDNLGLQGRMPTHATLLDYLARELIEGGWDVKAMLRRIVLSATYRQDSVAMPERRRADPENRLLSRGPRKRLEAEMIRDTALAAAGLLVREVGGPPAHPYQPEGLWRAFNSMSPRYTQGEGDQLYRRSLYTVWKRTAPAPSMTSFDAPGREACVARRTETSTPLQALVLLNDVQFVEASRVLAQRSMREHDDDDARIASMFRRLTGRSPVPRERAILLALLADQRAVYGDDPAAAARLATIGASAPEAGLDPVELAALTIVAQAILNADATIWLR